MLNEPSVFEPLKFYCIFFDIRGYFEESVFEIARLDCILFHMHLGGAFLWLDRKMLILCRKGPSSSLVKVISEMFAWPRGYKTFFMLISVEHYI